MVVAVHTFLLRDADGVVGWLTSAARWGWLGVDLFFVLSGFLITGIVLRQPRTPRGLMHFYLRRIARTWPLYYLCLLLAVTVLPYSSYYASTALRDLEHNQLWFWLHASNWLMGLRAAWSAEFVSHFWSLAVEEQFYLVWPLLVWAGWRWCAVWPAAVCGAAVLLGVVTRQWLWWNDAPMLPMLVLTPCKADLLGWGGLAAWWLWRDPSLAGRRRRLGALMALCVTAFCGAVAGFYGVTGRWAVEQSFHAWVLPWFGPMAACGILLCLRPSRPLQTVLGRGPLPWFGRYSYGLYVLHLFIRPVVDHHAGPSAWGVWLGPNGGTLGYAFTVLACSTLLAVASYHLMESRILRAVRRRTVGSAAAGPCLPGEGVIGRREGGVPLSPTRHSGLP